MEQYKCLIIDDEPLAGKGLQEYIFEVSVLECIAVIHTPAEAIRYIGKVDIMFLDINMPLISGIDFLKHLKHPPLTVITTAYPQYALQSFDLDVVDYLLKPISFPRFMKAVNKTIDFLQLRNNKETDKTHEKEAYFFVKADGVLEKIYYDEVLVIEGLANYVTIHCTNKKIITYLTLKQIKDYLPDNQFVQVHKSFIVAIVKVGKIAPETLTIQTMEIPVGANFRSIVVEQITGGKILKR